MSKIILFLQKKKKKKREMEDSEKVKESHDSPLASPSSAPMWVHMSISHTLHKMGAYENFASLLSVRESIFYYMTLWASHKNVSLKFVRLTCLWNIGHSTTLIDSLWSSRWSQLFQGPRWRRLSCLVSISLEWSLWAHDFIG